MILNTGARASPSFLQLCYSLPELAELLFKDSRQENPNSFPGASQNNCWDLNYGKKNFWKDCLKTKATEEKNRALVFKYSEMLLVEG